jgi:hypothetical protein
MMVRLRARFSLLFLLAAGTLCGAPADDELGAAEALIRWHIATQKLEASRGSARLFVSVEGKDLPAQAVEDLRDTGLEYFPHGDFKPSSQDVTVGSNWSLSIGKLVPRADGDYDVDWGYYCGMLCAASSTAVLHHDAGGWDVVKSELHWIS